MLPTQAILSVVMVLSNATNQKGTGWLVSNNHIVTNEHVIRGNTSGDIEVIFSDGLVHKVSGIIFDPLTDLAILELAQEVALRSAIEFQEHQLSDEQISEFAKAIPMLDEFLNLQYPDYELTPTYKMLSAYPRKLNLGLNENASISEMLKIAIKEMRENQWLGTHRDAILREYAAVRNKRMMAFMENAGTSRAFDDLRRSFSKLLAEYRRHEAWLRDRGSIDMGVIETAPA